MPDHIIPKPTTIAGYSNHQIVEGLTGGARPLFVDRGDALIVRSDLPLTSDPRPVRSLDLGSVSGFRLEASCYVKTRGKRRYLRVGDHAARRAWLDAKAAQHGFEVLTVVSRSDPMGIKTFQVDRTTFVGVLRVTDAEVFAAAVKDGIKGAGARAFGLSMLQI